MYIRLKKLSKKIAVFVVALMMLCVPMSVKAAEAEIIVEPSTGTLYKGESVVITFDTSQCTYDYNYKEMRLSSVGADGMFHNEVKKFSIGTYNGLLIEKIETDKYKLTNVSCEDSFDFTINVYGTTSQWDIYGTNLATCAFTFSSNSKVSSEFSTLLDNATTLVDYGITFMQSFLDFIVSNPVILLAFIIVLCGLGIVLLFRIIHSA